MTAITTNYNSYGAQAKIKFYSLLPKAFSPKLCGLSSGTFYFQKRKEMKCRPTKIAQSKEEERKHFNCKLVSILIGINYSFLQMLAAIFSIKTIPTSFLFPWKKELEFRQFTLLSEHTATLHGPAALMVRCGLVTHFWPMECKPKWYLMIPPGLLAPIRTLLCFFRLPDWSDNLWSTLGATF